MTTTSTARTVECEYAELIIAHKHAPTEARPYVVEAMEQLGVELMRKTGRFDTTHAVFAPDSTIWLIGLSRRQRDNEVQYRTSHWTPRQWTAATPDRQRKLLAWVRCSDCRAALDDFTRRLPKQAGRRGGKDITRQQLRDVERRELDGTAYRRR